MASGHVNRIKRPNTWLHRPMLQNVKKALANPEPSTHGTFATCRHVCDVVAIRGNADVARTSRFCSDWTRNGHFMIATTATRIVRRVQTLERSTSSSEEENCPAITARLWRRRRRHRRSGRLLYVSRWRGAVSPTNGESERRVHVCGEQRPARVEG